MNVHGPPKSADWSVANGSYYEDYPLDLDGDSIRILTIHPGSWADPVSGKQHVAPLRVARYDALSYTWRRASKIEAITMCGRAGFAVTANLYAALKRLRQHKVRTVWIDAICVNQADFKERSAQVQLMKAIYSYAATVLCLAWTLQRHVIGDAQYRDLPS